MGKKRKKIVRPQYTTKEVRIKQAPKKPVPKELKWGLIFVAVALVVAIILFFALYDDGSLPVKDGVAVMEDNWIVANTGTTSSPKYYKIGEVAPIEGFALTDEDFGTDTLKVFTYRPEDSESRIDYYTVAGIKGVPADNVQTINDTYASWMTELEVGPVEHVTIGDMDVDYFTSATPPVTEEELAQAPEGFEYTKQYLNAYVPSVRDTSVLVTVVVKTSMEYPGMSDAEFVEVLEEITDAITFETK